MASLRTWVFILVLLVGGPIMCLATHAKNEDLTKIQDHGKLATADIRKVEWKTSHGLKSDYKLTVEFTPEGGELTKVQLAVDNQVGKAAEDDQKQSIDVKYLPESPQIVYPADDISQSPFGYYMGAGMFLGGLIMIFRRRKQK